MRWPAEKGPDWIDTNGRLWDAMRMKSSFFDSEWAWGNIQNSITKHLNKAHLIPIDVSDLTSAQLATLTQYVAPNRWKVVLIR
ncbi:hypothetical protein [Saccharothrix espanaensis]|uniref:CdiA C-terminal tRNase domain-containing protein n=1 Tax=Saccharothrix espanaensis (strain ATCC 51144 / DSM 44229 / JCM 9112 / NBRC 15066 / NRRL 15764) TaxID=1179773 RepID=K0JTU9_SACES|nr:hypothetical protein BN6_20340 [Saccharothrix espanaensis DSM 44229]